MRSGKRRNSDGVRLGRRGKLRALLRSQLETSGGGVTASWLADLAEEESDAAAFFGDRVGRSEVPSILPGCECVWTAFWTLTDDRQWRVQGFGTPMGATIIEGIPTRIPYRTIAAYARDMQIEGEEFDRFLRYLRAIDGEYIEIMGEQMRERYQRMQK